MGQETPILKILLCYVGKKWINVVTIISNNFFKMRVSFPKAIPQVKLIKQKICIIEEQV